MIRGLYIAGTGMLTQRRQTDTAAGNIANLQTAGFKRDQALVRSFGDVLIERINDANAASSQWVGPLNYGIRSDEILTDHEQGPLEATGKFGDLALTGRGFFTVDTPGGERYIRGGTFSVDADGSLVSAEGYVLVGQRGRIQLGSDDFTVDSLGHVYAGGMYADTLRLVDFTDTRQMVKEGHLLYRNEGGAGNLQPFAGEVAQGTLEASNVDLTAELVQMMASMRNHDTNQRVVRMLDDTLSKTVNEIGRL